MFSPSRCCPICTQRLILCTYVFGIQMECESNLRKAKHAYMARCEEHDKAKAAASRAAEEDGGGSTTKSLGKKLRVEEDARNKVPITAYVVFPPFSLISTLLLISPPPISPPHISPSLFSPSPLQGNLLKSRMTASRCQSLWPYFIEYCMPLA